MILSSIALAQDNNDNFPRYQLSVSYGPQYNNFVDYGQDITTTEGIIIPLEGFPGESALLQKREIGTYFNVTASIRIGGRNYLELSHTRTLNQGVYNGIVFFPNETVVTIEDFQLRHRNHFYNIGYRRNFTKRFSSGIGISYLQDQRSVINIFPQFGTVEIAERNFKNSYTEELAIYLNTSYDVYESGKFTLGIDASAYLIISAGTEFETISLTPYLRFNF